MRTTSLIGAVCILFSGAAFAQVVTNSMRPLTVEETVQMALANNYDVQIQRYNPAIGEFNYERLRALYYDPVFGTTVAYNYNSQEGSPINQTSGLVQPSSVTETTTFAPGIRGALPTGLTYDFSQNLLHHMGTSGVNGPKPRTFDFEDGDAGVTLRQPLLRNLWIDASRRDIWIARRDLKISQENYRLQLMTTANSVEKAYYELIFAREQVRVQEMAVELAERLLSENRRRVEVGTMAPLDEKQAQSQAASSHAALISAQQQLLISENNLKSITSNNYREWQQTTVLPTDKLLAIPERFDLQDSWTTGVARRPELQSLRLELEKSDINLRYQRNQIFPQLDLTGSYGRNGSSTAFGGVIHDTATGDNPFYSIGAVFSIPLSLRGPKAAYNATKAQKEQAILRYKREEQIVLLSIQNAIGTAQSSLARIKATAEAREYAESALQAEQKKLENGKSTSFNVLQLQRDLTQRRSEEIRALADYNEALADLALQEGTTLERHHFAVNFK